MSIIYRSANNYEDGCHYNLVEVALKSCLETTLLKKINTAHNFLWDTQNNRKHYFLGISSFGRPNWHDDKLEWSWEKKVAMSTKGSYVADIFVCKTCSTYSNYTIYKFL